MTAVIAEDVQCYLLDNNLWDLQQKGTQKGILGTVDNLLVDRAVIEEAKEYERNLAVAYYDYEKAYDSTPHSWQIKCFQMCGIHETVVEILQQLQSVWKTRLEIWSEGEVERSTQIKFKRGFFQGDALSPVGFCITEIPLGILLSQMPGYGMGLPNQRDIKVNRFYFIDDLKLIQGSEADLIRANKVVGTVSTAMGMRFGIAKCAEIIYKRGKMVKGEGLELIEGRINALDPEQKEFYTFLGMEEGEGHLDMKVKERVTEKCFSLVNQLADMELYERNFVKAVNSKAMATVRYSMSICHFTRTEIRELDIRMRKLLLHKRIRGPQESIERLYLPKEFGGRGFFSFELIYNMAKILSAVYLCLTNDQMLQKVFQRERAKISWKNPVREAELAFEEVGHKLSLEAGSVTLDGSLLKGSPIQIRKRATNSYKNWWKEMLVKEYESTVVKSIIWKEVRTIGNGFGWMRKNVTCQQVGRVLRVQEQMVQNKGLLKTWGKIVQNDKCRLCGKSTEGVKHWLNSCEYLAGIEYLKRHDQTLRVFYMEVLKKFGLESEQKVWFNVNVEPVRENDHVLVVWNKRIKTHMKVNHRWPDLRIEDKAKKVIFIIDMSCPSDSNVIKKEDEKRRNYIDLVYELRTQRPGWRIETLPLVIGVTGAMNSIKEEIKKILEDESLVKRCVEEMQKTTVLASLQMIHRIETNLV
jgi:hypothetical protein